MRNCNQCGYLYEPVNKTSGLKFCSPECYHRSIKGKARKEARYSWGYRYIFLPSHPDTSKQGYVAEHRLVAEKMIRRRLRKDEIVHHKNHNRSDNRSENLLIFNRKEHNKNHPEFATKLKSPEAIKKMKFFATNRERDKKGKFIKITNLCAQSKS